MSVGGSTTWSRPRLFAAATILFAVLEKPLPVAFRFPL
jgi:hypothetical protein